MIKLLFFVELFRVVKFFKVVFGVIVITRIQIRRKYFEKIIEAATAIKLEITKTTFIIKCTNCVGFPI